MLSITRTKYTSRKQIKLSLHSMQKLRDLEFEEKVSSIYKKYTGFEPTHLELC